jgi:thiamine biosynthesis lipoprotein
MGRTARQRLRLNRAALLGAALLGLAACSPGPPTREHWTAFGTAAELQLPAGTTEAKRVETARRVAALWQDREDDWHPWRPSALTRFNAELIERGEAIAPAALRPLIERSRPLVDESGSAFDPGVGRLVAAWGFHTSDYPIRTPPPDEAMLEAWAARPDSLRDLACDTGWRCTTRAPSLQLDFNAVAEGLALEEAAFELRALAVDDVRLPGALLNLGGDVLALGDNDGVPWRVGLDDGEGGVLGGVELRDGEAFMSSGRYAKYRESPDGERWPHVLDPRSGRPETGARLSAVLHPDPLRADAAATALLAAGPEGFERIVRGMRLGCALLVDAEGRSWITAGMATRFEWERELPSATRIDAGEGCGTR